MSAKPFRSDLGWKWEAFAGRWLLVTDGGGQQVIMSPDKLSHIRTLDLETGVLRNISPSDYIAKVIAAAPDLRQYAQSLINGIDIGLVRIDTDADETLANVLTGLRQALAKCGPVPVAPLHEPERF
jgi:hypothetical protein